MQSFYYDLSHLLGEVCFEVTVLLNIKNQSVARWYMDDSSRTKPTGNNNKITHAHTRTHTRARKQNQVTFSNIRRRQHQTNNSRMQKLALAPCHGNTHQHHANCR